MKTLFGKFFIPVYLVILFCLQGKADDFSARSIAVNLSSGGMVSIRANPYRYSAYYADGESGLCYCKARYYSPGTSTFTTRDTFDLPGRYAYCGGNPVIFTDPTGHMRLSESIRAILRALDRRAAVVIRSRKLRRKNDILVIGCTQHAHAWHSINGASADTLDFKPGGTFKGTFPECTKTMSKKYELIMTEFIRIETFCHDGDKRYDYEDEISSEVKNRCATFGASAFNKIAKPECVIVLIGGGFSEGEPGYRVAEKLRDEYGFEMIYRHWRDCCISFCDVFLKNKTLMNGIVLRRGVSDERYLELKDEAINNFNTEFSQNVALEEVFEAK